MAFIAKVNILRTETIFGNHSENSCHLDGILLKEGIFGKVFDNHCSIVQISLAQSFASFFGQLAARNIVDKAKTVNPNQWFLVVLELF